MADSQHDEADDAPDSEEEPEQETQELELAFTGNALEYFRIWIVNTCLTLLTLGAFSAWAKVRKQRYIYSHTTLDGTAFEYLGSPLPILKGRIVIALLACIWFAITRIYPRATPIAYLLAAAVAPWIIVKSMIFRARASAFRNIRFVFCGSSRQAANRIYGLILGTLLTLGLRYAWLECGVRRYLLNHTRYGRTSGRLDATGRQFFVVNIKAALVASVLPILIAVELLEICYKNGRYTSIVMLVFPLSMTFLFFVYKQARVYSLCWSNTSFDGLFLRARLSFRGLLWLHLTNGLAIAGSFGLLIPWAMIRSLRYRIERTSVFIEGGFEQFEQAEAVPLETRGAEVVDVFDLDLAF